MYCNQITIYTIFYLLKGDHSGFKDEVFGSRGSGVQVLGVWNLGFRVQGSRWRVRALGVLS